MAHCFCFCRLVNKDHNPSKEAQNSPNDTSEGKTISLEASYKTYGGEAEGGKEEAVAVFCQL